MEAKIEVDEEVTLGRQAKTNNIPTPSPTPENSFQRYQGKSPKSGYPFERNYPSPEANQIFCIESEPISRSATQTQISPTQEIIKPIDDHKTTEVQIVPNEFGSSTTQDESDNRQENKKRDLEDDIETVDIKSIEDDARSPIEKNNKSNDIDSLDINNQETYALKRTRSNKDALRDGCSPKKFHIDKNYRRYEVPVIHPKSSAAEYQYFEELRRRNSDVLPPDYGAKVYSFPTQTVNSQLMYIPVERISDKEAVYRRAYYEEMLQRELQTQAKSAFNKPPNFDREAGELKVLVPKMRYEYSLIPQYVPYHEQFPARQEEKDNGKKLASQSTDHKRQLERMPEQNCKPSVGRKTELYDKYRFYEASKYASLDPRFALPSEFPYIPYRAPLVSWDKIHVESKCPYPCCTGLERLPGKESNDDVNVTDVHQYGRSPVFTLNQTKMGKLHDDAKLHMMKQSAAYDPNEIKPSFREFLDAERKRITENESEEKRNDDNAIQKKRQSVQLWDQNKTEIESMDVDNTTSNSTKELQTVEQPLKIKESPPKENTAFENTETQIQKANKCTVTDTADANAKKISCSVCNKTFNRTSNLYTHMKTHSTHKPHACEFCGKRFHQKADLRIHRYIHTGEKPHKCAKCGRGFKQLTHLKYHMRTHSDVRMYKCPYCEKGFNQKSNLQAHIFGHTGQRPHKCDVCGKGFTLASTLNTHKRTHLPNKPFQCQFCERAFYQKNALKMHYVSTHPYSSGAV